MKTVKPEHFYVPGLDGLRFIALMLVFFHHLIPVLQFPPETFLYDFWVQIGRFGWIGVDLFLCLSAYLITKLLLLEYEKTGDISFKKFMIRRSLRIWPLYFLALFLAFILLPLISNYIKLAPVINSAGWVELVTHHFLPFMFFAGNWSTGIYGYANGQMIAHLWTISLEEQFYIAWPLLFKHLKSMSGRTIYMALMVIYAGCVLARALSAYYGIEHPFIWVSTITRLDPMIVGVFLALWPGQGKVIGAFSSISLITIGLGMWLFVGFFPSIEHNSIHVHWQLPLTAIGAAMLVIATVRSPHVGRILGVPALVYLGKISYGGYVFHVLAISLSGYLVNRLPLPYSLPGMQAVIAFLIMVVLAAASYRFYERRWLLRKESFAVIQSRPV